MTLPPDDLDRLESAYSRCSWWTIALFAGLVATFCIGWPASDPLRPW